MSRLQDIYESLLTAGDLGHARVTFRTIIHSIRPDIEVTMGLTYTLCGETLSKPYMVEPAEGMGIRGIDMALDTRSFQFRKTKLTATMKKRRRDRWS